MTQRQDGYQAAVEMKEVWTNPWSDACTVFEKDAFIEWFMGWCEGNQVKDNFES